MKVTEEPLGKEWEDFFKQADKMLAKADKRRKERKKERMNRKNGRKANRS